MDKAIMFMVLIVSSLAVNASVGYCQRNKQPPRLSETKQLDKEARREEKEWHERVNFVRKNKEEILTPEQVSSLLGMPERIVRRQEGSDAIEIWGYEGFDVRCQFRNGVVEDWFFRFMPENSSKKPGKKPGKKPSE